MKNKALVVGASGLIGVAAIEAFLSAGWDVIGLSRRKPTLPSGRDFDFVPVDLRDERASHAVLSGLTGVSHVAYAAIYEKADDLVRGWSSLDQIAINDAMLRNVIEPLVSGKVQAQARLHSAGHEGLWRSPAPHQHSRPGGRSARWARELLLRPAGLCPRRGGRPRLQLHGASSPAGHRRDGGCAQRAAGHRRLRRDPVAKKGGSPSAFPAGRRSSGEDSGRRSGRPVHGLGGTGRAGGERDLQRHQRRCLRMAKRVAGDGEDPGCRAWARTRRPALRPTSATTPTFGRRSSPGTALRAASCGPSSARATSTPTSPSPTERPQGRSPS